jgi:tetratricopeptide (TPR) repeat protein
MRRGGPVLPTPKTSPNPASPHPLPVPSPLPSIELGPELGAGTTGVVRRGRLREAFGDLPARTEVAVKRLAPKAQPPAAAALEAEAHVLAIAHGLPHLAQLVFTGEDEHGPLLITRLVPGPDLRSFVDQGPVPEARVRELGGDLATGLAGLHRAGWWHGDVKPENVRLDQHGRAVLLDLGFARPTDPDGNPRASGSLPYLSPEQCAGRPGGPAADTFALGVVLVELCTGALPCAPPEDERADPQAWLTARRGATGFVPSSLNPRLSPLFDVIVAGLLAPNPSARPPLEQVAQRLIEGEAGAWWREYLRQGTLPMLDPRSRLEAGRLPMAGRRKELDQLAGAYAEATAGRGGAIWLEGDEGSGKSRLVAEFVAAQRQREDPPTYLDGSCSEFEEERPGQPLRALIRRWLHLPRRAALAPRDRELLAQLVPPVTLQALASALDPSAEEAGAGEPEALATTLVRLGQSRPLVVFLDDLTFADEVTLDGLAHLADRLAESRVLLVLGLRWGTPARHPVRLENLRARLATRAPVSTLALGPLSEGDVLELVRQLFHHSAPSLRLARVLIERTGGWPGVLAELLRTLQRRGLIRRRAGDGPFELLVAPDELPEPGSVARMIRERYEGLPEDQRRWLRRLAVVGGHLEPEFLVRAFPGATLDGVRELLAEFQAQGWLIAMDGRHRFARVVQRDRVYHLIPEGERVETHLLAAQALAEESGRDRSFQRIYHLHAAGQHGELVELALPLIRQVLAGGHPGRISTLAGWALESLAQLPRGPGYERTRAELLEAAADAADRLGRRRDQRRWLDQLTDLELDPQTNPEAVGRVYLLHGRCAANTGNYRAARDMLRDAAAHFRRALVPARESEALLRLAHVQGHIGELEDAERLARRALELATDQVQKAHCQLAQGVLALVNDSFEEALRLIDRASARLRREDCPTGGRGALAAAYLLRARTYRLVGRPRRAYAAMLRAGRLAAEAGERRLQAEIAARHGRLLLDLDRTDQAELVLRDALLSCQESEYRRGHALASVFLGTLLAEAGDPEAPSMLARTADQAHQMGLGRIEALCLALRARVERGLGRPAEAGAHARAAHDLITRFGGELSDRVVVTATLAMLLREAGEGEEAGHIEEDLRRRVRRVNGRIQAPVLRQRHHRATRSLLEAALSPDGPVYPRMAFPDLVGSFPMV